MDIYRERPIKNRKGPVVLVSKSIEYTFPFSYAYLAGYLRQFGEDVHVLFSPYPQNYDKLVKQILDMNPVLIGFGSLYPELPLVADLISLLNRGGCQVPIVIGGQMVSPIPEFAVKVTGADFGVIGEGEITLFKLVKALREGGDPYSIGVLAIREGDRVMLTGPGEFIEDLSKLPPIPYDLFPESTWLPVGRFYTDRAQPHWRFDDRVIPIHGGRGCPFHCNFCYHHSRARYRSIPDMMAEAVEQLDRFRGNMLYFGDDLVIATPKRARELADAFSQLKKPVEYSVSAKFDVLERIDDNLLSDMKETGCRIMGMGIESGSQRILDIIDKKTTVAQIRRGLQRLRKVGILPTVSIMVGQLSETVEDVEASIALMRESVRNDKNIQYAFTITTPFPGSPLYKLALHKGYLRNDQDFYDKYDLKKGEFQLVVNLSAMSDEEVLAMRRKISRIYEEEKTLAIGSSVVIVESVRAFLHRGNSVLHRRLWPQFSSHGFLSIVPKVYQSVYEFIQSALDTWRLRLLGINSRSQ